MNSSLRLSFLAACLSAMPLVAPSLAQTLAAAPASAATSTATAAHAIVPLMEVEKLQSLIDHKKKFFLLDVRRADEFDQGHIDGATLIPLDQLAARLGEVPKTGKLVVYCRSGHRSAQAVSLLREHGYRNAVSLAGGFLAWTKAHELKM